MQSSFNSVSIIVPALNEEKSVESTVKEILETFKNHSIDGEIILIDDGSTDKTGNIADNLGKTEKNVTVIHHSKPMGLGSCFREGTQKATKKAVAWLPGDGENEPYEIIKYLSILEHTDIANPYVINFNERPLSRRILSKTYLFIVNTAFGTSFHYTNGNVLYKTEIFKKIQNISNGFFYQTECLTKAVKAGFTYAEVPVLLKKRTHGKSKATSLKSAVRVAREFLRVFFQIHFRKESKTL
ncbi:MAG: hypothetical protein A2252_03055 [Elusimicrobia bacterium RIFOXYA2_FULL_39_19]|nr:MAG: hypothetical protein A2252_03055 [Elusimicrobia bacterium RIFOXYA2_FULL_39_19]